MREWKAFLSKRRLNPPPTVEDGVEGYPKIPGVYKAEALDIEEEN
jgi:hypothetical protein